MVGCGHALHSNPLLNYLVSDILSQRDSQHRAFHNPLRGYQSSFLVVSYVSLAHNTAAKTVPLKRLSRRVLFSFALSTYFIMVNAFQSDFILGEISASMSQCIFPIHPKYTYSFISSISPLPKTIQLFGTRALSFYAFYFVADGLTSIVNLNMERNWLVVGWLVGFYGISTFIGYLTQKPFLCKYSVLFQTIKFSMSTQFNCQKHFYFKLFSLVKQF